MSVPTWRRSESATEYLWQIYKLNVEVAEIVANKPKKYKSTHSDLIIKYSLEALAKANMANDIFVKSENEFEKREACLAEARAHIYNVALLSDIFLELCKRSPDCDKKKCTTQQERIGKRCAACVKLIAGVMRSDKKRYKG